MNNHIIILGGDGFLGWPTAMYFSQRGYQVTVVDNYMRRNNCQDWDVGMLYPVPSLVERTKIWYELTCKEIKVVIGDLADPEVMGGLSTVGLSIETSVASPKLLCIMLSNPPLPFQ